MWALRRASTGTRARWARRWNPQLEPEYANFLNDLRDAPTGPVTDETYTQAHITPVFVDAVIQKVHAGFCLVRCRRTLWHLRKKETIRELAWDRPEFR